MMALPSPCNDPVHWDEPIPGFDPNRRRGKRSLLGFGSPSVENKRKGDVTYDYEEKYEPDPEYKEMGSTARVWKTYLDESKKFDEQRIDAWLDILDVLLVFSSLFTLVVAALVSRTFNSLKINYREVMSILMTELVEINRALANGGSVSDIARSVTTFEAAQSDLWVNGLWFTSFALSLLIAIICMLAKQWLRQYMSFSSGDPRDCARIRHFRHMCLEKWHVPTIISLLPALMHIAIGMFFVGLVIFVSSFSTSMAFTFSSITGAGFIAYTGVTILPLVYPGCPYKTTLSGYVFAAYRRYMKRSPEVSVNSKEDILLEAERQDIMKSCAELDTKALCWLHDVSKNPSARILIDQALKAPRAV